MLLGPKPHSCRFVPLILSISFDTLLSLVAYAKMRLFTKSRKDKQPECELKFEKAYHEIHIRLDTLLSYGVSGGVAVHDYFPRPKRLGQAIFARTTGDRYPPKISASDQTEILGARRRLWDRQNLPGYSSVVPSILAEELQKLREEYWRYQCSIRLLNSVKPINSAPVQEQMVLRRHRDRHGRLYSWVMGQNGCAAWGGCCGRGYGCCEKTLDQCLSPVRDQTQNATNEPKVLGHCTVECRCCIDYRGCYIPDSRLPPLTL